MKISLQMIKEKNACELGVQWFEKTFGLESEYQEILNGLAKDETIDDCAVLWANWLINAFGKLNTVEKIEGNLKVKFGFFAGSIVVTGKIIVEKCLLSGGSIEAGLSIEAGGSIEARGSIKARGSIEAGLSIKARGSIEAGLFIEARGSIEAGDDYAIYVGLSLKLSLRDKYAIIKCKNEPKNLLLGKWEKDE
jgi:hypothetical protein